MLESTTELIEDATINLNNTENVDNVIDNEIDGDLESELEKEYLDLIREYNLTNIDDNIYIKNRTTSDVLISKENMEDHNNETQTVNKERSDFVVVDDINTIENTSFEDIQNNIDVTEKYGNQYVDSTPKQESLNIPIIEHKNNALNVTIESNDTINTSKETNSNSLNKSKGDHENVLSENQKYDNTENNNPEIDNIENTSNTVEYNKAQLILNRLSLNAYQLRNNKNYDINK